ncbi:hypothetical protein CEG14_11265 [Bordetella genomosp. 1]|uniref:Uncharacterized protein n=1 Tax=Bordetella genomosp. 1 TaxID=1395607 RepID=A0A261SE03_9BORD|nr:Nif11-like leader peptide family natural product precursor [Bordetella genomosp. 1]MDQ8032224.1 Nif11-like leader peptide family natural product precursor [Bordetella sp.]OZI35638.1 hypothetical protein CEG14_11265 [Bordetella genomosp. 1]OZI64165.1 hypothetical protein CAL27_16470 [Bordetella genomosp. 1]
MSRENVRKLLSMTAGDSELRERVERLCDGNAISSAARVVRLAEDLGITFRIEPFLVEMQARTQAARDKAAADGRPDDGPARWRFN